MDAYDSAVIHRREDGKVKITRKHETPTRAGGVLGGGAGLATGLVVALFPFAAVGGGLLAATTAGGAVLGALAGHAAAGMSRNDLKPRRVPGRGAGRPGRRRRDGHGGKDRGGYAPLGKDAEEAAQGRRRGARARREGSQRPVVAPGSRASAAGPLLAIFLELL